MRETPERISVWEEHIFWLKILEEHAHVIYKYLAPSETKWIRVAKQYMNAFKKLRQQVETIDSTLPFKSKKMICFAQQSYPIAFGYCRFEGHLQHLRVQNLVNLNISPTYLKDTLNENEEYLRILSFAMHGKSSSEFSLSLFKTNSSMK